MIKIKWLCIGLLGLLISCQEENTKPLHSPPLFMEIPNGFSDIEYPEDNLFTQERWELGKRLFYDPVMSSDSSISCATCHFDPIKYGL